jgi:capsular exopolysaccharide synthesis family protein
VLRPGAKDDDATEQYRIIRTKILQSYLQPRLIVVSSAGAGDGKTVTSVNIAAALALKNHERVLIVEGDLRRPTMAKVLGLPRSPGLSNVLRGTAPVETAVIQIESLPSLYVLPAGAGAGNPAELLDSPQWRTLCEQLRRQFEFVIIDAPPVGAVTDFQLIEPMCDGIIAVIRIDHTNRTVLQNMLFEIPPGKLIGIVLNSVEEWFFWRSRGYSYYRSERAEAAD